MIFLATHLHAATIPTDNKAMNRIVATTLGILETLAAFFLLPTIAAARPAPTSAPTAVPFAVPISYTIGGTLTAPVSTYNRTPAISGHVNLSFEGRGEGWYYLSRAGAEPAIKSYSWQQPHTLRADINRMSEYSFPPGIPSRRTRCLFHTSDQTALDIRQVPYTTGFGTLAEINSGLPIILTLREDYTRLPKPPECAAASAAGLFRGVQQWPPATYTQVPRPYTVSCLPRGATQPLQSFSPWCLPIPGSIMTITQPMRQAAFPTASGTVTITITFADPTQADPKNLPDVW